MKYARFTKCMSLLLCLMLVAGIAGSAAAGDVNVLEKMGESVVNVLMKMFMNTGDSAEAATWADLKLAAMQGKAVVVVTADIAFGADQGTIVFRKPVTLMSAEGGHFTIDGGGRQIICIQGDSADIPLDGTSYAINLTFQNGDATQESSDVYGTGAGGALFVMGDLRASGCTFTGNTAYYGAAVCVHGGLTLENCTVQRNYTPLAGAAYALNGDINVIGGTVSGNTSDQYGGGLYAHNGNITLTGASVTENAAQYGGGIYAQYGGVSVLGGTAVDGNYAAVSGGAIYTDEGTVSMADGTMNGNTAQYGGAVYTDSGECVFSGGTLLENTADYGGAIFSQAGSVAFSGEVNVTANKAEVSGGCVYDHTGTVSVAGGTLSGNSAMYGGCVYADSGNVEVSGGVAAGNSAQYGGVIYLTGGNVSMTGGTLKDNAVEGSGGAIYADQGSVDIAGGTIKGNTAAVYGGGVLAAAGAINISAGVIFGNSADFGGGLYSVSGAVTVSGGRVSGNKASTSGGGAYLEAGAVDDPLGVFYANTPDDVVVPPQ